MADFNGIRIKNLGEFGRVMKQYREVSSRKDPKVILDTKAFYICRGAVRETMGPTRQRIENELVNLRTSKTAPDAPLAAIIINARRGAKGDAGLFGKLMAVAVKALVSARIRSRRFIASGWLQNIKDLEPYAEQKNRAPRRDSTVKQFGRPKGGASPASRNADSAVSRTIIANAASSNHDLKDALEKYGMPAFLKAWQAEIDSMKQYIMDKMRRRAQEHGFKVN